MHKYRDMKLHGKLMFIVTLISLLFVIPYIVYFILLSNNNVTLESLQGIIHIMTPILIISFVVIWLVSIALARKFFTRVVEPIEKVSAAAQDMADGKLNVNIDFESSDEVGLLVQSLNSFSKNMTAAVKEIIFLLEALAKGDFTVKSHVVWKGDWARINQSIEDIFRSLNQIFSSVKNASDQTTSGSEQVASGSQALAQGATEQASAIEQLSATIVEVSDHVKGNAANAAEANRFSSEEEKKLKDANAQMDDMMKAMTDISDTSKKIGNIIKTIDDIAFQTNILALNAAVEAARAGSAGRGFAVVADEVRNLASKSAEAAKDTTALIENAIKAVNNGSKVADATEKTLLEVIQSANHTNSLVNEIATASNQQATSISQITQGIQQISAVVQTNSATAEESAAASEELAAQAKELKSTVAGIKLAGSTQKTVKRETAKTVVPKKAPVPSESKKAAVKGKTAQPHQPAAVPAHAHVSNDKYI